MHKVIEPSILYFGTPVVLLSTLNEDATANVAPMSSAWWLRWNCMLGLGSASQTSQNLMRSRECVLNLPSVNEVSAVNRLAKLTAADPVPARKQAMGYRHERGKFEVAGLTAEASDLVAPPRIQECPVQLEAVLEKVHEFATSAHAFEVRIVRAHVAEQVLRTDREHHIDPEKWRPLIMSFCQFYGLGEQIHPSTLAEIPETAYRPAAKMGR